DCNRLFFDNFKIKHPVCMQCRTKTVKEKYFSRLRIERIAFIYTISFILTLLMIFSGALKNIESQITGYVMLFVFFITGALMFMFWLKNEYLNQPLFGKPVERNELDRMNIFKESYLKENKPKENEIGFSWKKYFYEFYNVIGAIIIFVFLGAIVYFSRKLF
ncbi:MAG: hypothetical protein ACQERT_16475, partial [Thermodesulfobacteriota bacterium]